MTDSRDINNQGDYISGEIGEDGKDVIVGKNIDVRHTHNGNQQRNDNIINVIPPGHPASRATIADLYVALAGDVLEDKPGLIKRVTDIEKRLGVVEAEVIDIKKLVIVRNETRDQVHLTAAQIFWGVFALLVVAVVLSYFVGTWARGGIVDGRIGLAIPLLFNS